MYMYMLSIYRIDFPNVIFPRFKKAATIYGLCIGVIKHPNVRKKWGYENDKPCAHHHSIRSYNINYSSNLIIIIFSLIMRVGVIDL